MLLISNSFLDLIKKALALHDKGKIWAAGQQVELRKMAGGVEAAEGPRVKLADWTCVHKEVPHLSEHPNVHFQLVLELFGLHGWPTPWAGPQDHTVTPWLGGCGVPSVKWDAPLLWLNNHHATESPPKKVPVTIIEGLELQRRHFFWFNGDTR